MEQVGLGGVGIELDTGATGQVLGQGLAQLAQLDQGGVGVTGENLLGRARKLQEDGIVLLEEGEITAGCHGRSLESHSLAALN